MAVVTSEANHSRMDAIRADLRTIADPREAGNAADAAASRTPAVAWMGYTVHGNEASGTEAAIGLLYQLAAGQDAETRMVLDSAVVLIDPIQNPDGHERHVHYTWRVRGANGISTVPGTMSHGSDWPGARTSHYYFDLNRDWDAQSHPETRGRVQSMRRGGHGQVPPWVGSSCSTAPSTRPTAATCMATSTSRTPAT